MNILKLVFTGFPLIQETSKCFLLFIIYISSKKNWVTFLLIVSIAVCLGDKYASSCWRKPSDPCPVCSWQKSGLQVLFVSESKVILLSAQQTDKSRDKVFVFSNFIWKVRRPRRWWTRVPKNHHAQIRIQSSFIPKEEGVWVWLVVANFLVSEFFVFEPIHLGQVMMFFDCVDHIKLWKILKERRISDHLNCLLRNLYAGQEATVRTGHGTTDWLQIGKGVHQGCILSPCLLRCREHHEKCRARWSTIWNQDSWEKYQ